MPIFAGFIGALALLLPLQVNGASDRQVLHPPHPTRIIVQPSGPHAVPALEKFHAERHNRVQRTFPGLSHLAVISLPSGRSVSQALESYRASGLVQFAEPDYRVAAAATLPNDPRFQDGTQWYLNNYGQSGGLAGADIDAPDAWDVIHPPGVVVVAIIDSGIRQTHEDLAGILWRNPADQSPGYNALTGKHDPWDNNGHGTHLAGILSATPNNGRGIAGIAWHSRIMACKFLDQAGTGYLSDAIACIEFARSNGASVINLSWGGADPSLALSNALSTARSDGILVIAAAGNNAANIDLNPFYPASFRFDNLISVAASTRNETLWSLSSYGTNAVHLVAPGASILSSAFTSDSAYESRNGTSMAAATVAGAAAALRALFPCASPQQIRERLLTSADQLPVYANRCLSGGRLNLRKAVDFPLLEIWSTTPDLQLRLKGAPNHAYVIDTSPDLHTWSPTATNRPPTGTWIIDAQPTLPQIFYRARPQ
jgi:subtilisin family serine protease